MKKAIKASLAYAGRNVPWLAKQLGIGESTCRKRLNDDLWTLPQLRRMKELFKWQTLEGGMVWQRSLYLQTGCLELP